MIMHVRLWCCAFNWYAKNCLGEFKPPVKCVANLSKLCYCKYDDSVSQFSETVGTLNTWLEHENNTLHACEIIFITLPANIQIKL